MMNILNKLNTIQSLGQEEIDSPASNGNNHHLFLHFYIFTSNFRYISGISSRWRLGFIEYINM